MNNPFVMFSGIFKLFFSSGHHIAGLKSYLTVVFDFPGKIELSP